MEMRDSAEKVTMGREKSQKAIDFLSRITCNANGLQNANEW